MLWETNYRRKVKLFYSLHLKMLKVREPCLGTEYIFKRPLSEEKLDTTLTEQPKLLPPRRTRWTRYTSGCDTLRRTQDYLF